ncbi:potassium channel family protein [Microbacterium sp.]|uniref:potassium channel family protein n=1 Tax=Microbacterium sp. TaxID=51671 RepID=UPI0039E28E07
MIAAQGVPASAAHQFRPGPFLRSRLDNRRMYGERVARWERMVEWPLMGAAVAFLLAYAVQILVRPDGIVATTCELLLCVTWVLFAVDYVVRLAVAESRRQWFYRHLLDLAIVVLPMLRPLRLMRFLTIIALIQRGAGTMLRGKVVVYTVGATVMMIFLAALAVLDAEQGADGSIQTFGDALWRAFVTITTVGYGDLSPVTPTGRVVAAGLMIGGIALIGVVTATLASWIVDKVSVESESTAAATEAQVKALHAEVIGLREQIAELSSPSGGTQRSSGPGSRVPRSAVTAPSDRGISR